MNKEKQDQARRVMTAIMVSTVFFILWQAFLVGPPDEELLEETETDVHEVAQETATDEVDTPAPADAPRDTAAPADEGVDAPDAPSVDAVESLVMRTENFEARFTNTGGRLAYLQILSPLKYVPRDDMRGIFPEHASIVRADDRRKLPATLRLDGRERVDDSTMYEVDTQAMDEDDDLIAFVYRSPDGSYEVRRTFRPDSHSFGIEMDVEIRNLGDAPIRWDALHMDTFGEFDSTSGGMLNPAASVVEAICASDSRVERTHGRRVEDPEHYTPGPIAFVGANERYFMNALAPRSLPDGVSAERCSFERVGEWRVRARVSTDEFAIPAGDSASFSWTLYTGPKGQSFLEAFDQHLEKAIDLGWMSFLAVPIRWLLLYLQGFVVNWGLAIILLTVVIKSAMLPLTTKAFRSMEKMRSISPKVKELREKYENDPTKLAEEQMKLFRENGVNPLGGCLPMILQMPIYFALYQTIWGSAELYNADFILWITDLSQRDPYYLLPLLMGSVMFVQQKMMPTTVDNPQIKVMQTVMPIMFTVFMLWLPSGLVLYIFVNMVLSIGHQLWIRRNISSADEEDDTQAVEVQDGKVKETGGKGSLKKNKSGKKKKS